MENSGINCPSCSAFNRSREGRCEACGASLDWAVWKGRQQTWKFPRQWTAAACLLGGLATGALATTYVKNHTHTTPLPPPIVSNEGRPQIDVVFVIDTTGSMDDEIEVVKTQVREMMTKVQSGQPQPYVRFGVVAYRDRGDSYVTKTFPLTADIATIQNAVSGLRAAGGGDTPESVNEALHVGLQEMNWNFDQNTKKVMFLIGDAGPHMDYPNDYNYKDEMVWARSKGIKVHTWGCSGITDCGEPQFREIAALGGGDFQFLTYRQEVVKKDGTRANVLFQGKSVYEALPTANWKAGADKMASSEKHEVRGGEVSAPSAGAMPTYSSRSEYMETSGVMQNNLDTVLTKQVMEESAASGVKY